MKNQQKFPKRLLTRISEAPKEPGCYVFKDKKDRTLYIGKARILRNRVRQYLQNTKPLDPKIELMVEQIRDVEFITTDSEMEALILETNLIKKYKPKYNRLMKDDKNYLWVMITRYEDFPRITTTRQPKDKKALYFGPYPDGRPIQRTLKRVRRIFPFRTCRRAMVEVEKGGKKIVRCSNQKPCLYYHIKLCPAPCADFITKRDYRKNINDVIRFFRGQKSEILKRYEIRMKEFAEKQKFERAAVIRDKAEDVRYVTQKIYLDSHDDDLTIQSKKEQSAKEGVKKLAKRLNLKVSDSQLKTFRIEAYDISNLQGKSATGSMVVFVGGLAKKEHYRKFKIRTKEEPDDYGMMAEVLKRRMKRKKKPAFAKATEGKRKKTEKDKSFVEMPNLVVLDGGKGQLMVGLKVLNELKLEIPVIALAKKQEEVYRYDNGFKKMRLRRNSEALHLLQRLRDEAHRFAVSYHRKRRKLMASRR